MEKIMETYGRKIITTTEKEITKDNVIAVLEKAYQKFQEVRSEIVYLINFEKGKQEKIRTKKYRPDIDNWCIDNIANEVTEFNLGYIWGNPITLVQRGEKDTGKENESLPISMLNEYYQTIGINDKTQELGRYVEVDALGYTFVDINKDYIDGDSPFVVECLDPRTTFVVRSTAYLDKRVIMGVSFIENDNGEIYFTVFSKKFRFEISNMANKAGGNGIYQINGTWKNMLGEIPIVEWIRSHDRMGCFERQISEMQNLNLMVSDVVNDVEQTTNCVWWANNVEFPEEEVLDDNGKPTGETEVVKPKDGDWLNTSDAPDGKKAQIQPLSVNYDYDGLLSHITTRRSLILQKCNVPQRSAVGNGATGVAMDDATGWNHAETAAKKQQMIMESAKMQEVKLVLKAISVSPFLPVDSPLRKLRYTDVQPVIVRNRGYELTVKANALATMLSHGVYGLQAFKTIDIFPDVNQAWEDSKELVEKYQDSIFNKQSTTDIPDRLQGDISDQVNNSPVIDGNTKNDEGKVDGLVNN